MSTTSLAESTMSSPVPAVTTLTTSVASNPLEALELIDKECNSLGGLFQQIVNEMKVRTSFRHKPVSWFGIQVH